jgi:hypothetical protein
MMSFSEFRNQLDNVLRSKNPEAVRQFLIEQDQWDEDFPGDTEHAMWMMIAGSPTLKDLHTEALDWLMQHNYQAEAEMLRQRGQAPRKPSSTSARANSGARGKNLNARNKPAPNRGPRQHP